MDVSYLREFVTLMSLKSGAKAALALNIDPSTLSRHIHALEREFGVELLVRGKRTEFTPEAHAIAPAIANAINSIDAIYESIPRKRDSKVYPFRVYCPEGDLFCQEVFTSALISLQQYRDISIVEVPDVETSLRDALLDGVIDASFGFPAEAQAEDEFDYKEIFHRPVFVCVNKDSSLARGMGSSDCVELEQLDGYTLPVTMLQKIRVGFDSLANCFFNSGVGIRPEYVYANSAREYYLKLSGNRFCTSYDAGMDNIPATLRDRFRVYRVDDARIDARRVLTVRRGERGVAFLRLVAALEGAYQQLVAE